MAAKVDCLGGLATIQEKKDSPSVIILSPLHISKAVISNILEYKKVKVLSRANGT